MTHRQSAVLGLIFGILAVLLPSVGIVFGIAGIIITITLRNQLRDDEPAERKMMQAGLALSILGVLIQITLTLIGLLSFFQTPPGFL
ncbi:hypothetical protein [Alkalicoccus urumqiensis]|uniref:DUF4190 domain-containing protein n=1 Tax=Alkalicoccus urumqiensis TaxID=1548213 RepID=A0A2P6MJA6_ALKUR|nr:hypothetical protein [Alkalicoccus urumqiensis]PRO66351.1 hypothetical protein C6I21_05985 [Alkalicoccus urumqiensis]